MALDAIDLPAMNIGGVLAKCPRRSGDVADHLLVAFDAVVEHDLFAAVAHLNRLVKVLKGKSARMGVAVLGFGQIFGDKRMWDVAVVAGCGTMVAGLLPSVILVAHDVAIHTGLGIIREI